MRTGEFTVGDFTLFVSYLGGLSVAAGFVGQYMTQWRQVPVSVERLTSCMQDAPPRRLVEHGRSTSAARSRRSVPCPPIGDEALQSLEVRNLTYHYPETGRGHRGRVVHDAARLDDGGDRPDRLGQDDAGPRVLQGLLTARCREILWNGDRSSRPDTFFVPPHSAYTPQARGCSARRCATTSCSGCRRIRSTSTPPCTRR